jgi:IS5 family transposase
MKNDGKLGRNWLKGTLGDAMHEVLVGTGYKTRLIIEKLKSCGPIVRVYQNLQLFLADSLSGPSG